MKKTNIRIHRNGGSKTASPQVPNKPEPARARTGKTGQRFEGIVKSFNAELGFGFISVAAELATKLKLKPEQDLYFHADALPNGKAHLFRAGAQVSFAIKQGDKGPHAVAIQAQSTAEAVNQEPTHPATCEDELEEVIAKWGPNHRREAANKLERWVRQMLFSADILERFGHELDDEPELVFPSNELAEVLRGKTRSQCLAEAAKFEEWCGTIRRMLGVKLPLPTVTNPN